MTWWCRTYMCLRCKKCFKIPPVTCCIVSEFSRYFIVECCWIPRQSTSSRSHEIVFDASDSPTYEVVCEWLVVGRAFPNMIEQNTRSAPFVLLALTLLLASTKEVNWLSVPACIIIIHVLNCSSFQVPWIAFGIHHLWWTGDFHNRAQHTGCTTKVWPRVYGQI